MLVLGMTIPPLLIVLFGNVYFEFPWTLLSVLNGLILYTSFILYNKAMMFEEASKIVPLIFLNPIFVLPLAVVFLNEILNPVKYLGVILLTTSAILISYKKTEDKRYEFSRALPLMLILDLLLACCNIIAKYTLNFIDYWSFFHWSAIGGFIGGGLLLLSRYHRENFKRDISKIKIDSVFLMLFILGFVIYFIATIFFYKAMSLQYISIIAVIPSIQPFVVFIYTLILSTFAPNYLSEKIDKSTVSVKVSSFILIILGTLLIING